MGKFIDLTGQKFEKLTALYRTNDYVQPSGHHQTMWHCKCECGNECDIMADNLIRKRTKSCGCLQKEKATSFNEQAVYYYIKKIFPDAINSYKIKGQMEFDIYIPSKNIAFEIDGIIHNTQKQNLRDFKKNIYCLNNNIKLIRIRENGLNNFDNCICIFYKAERSLKSLDDTIIKAINLIDKTLKIDININRDLIEIYNSYITTEKLYNLEALYPEIAKEWHPTKNGKLKPNMVTSKSSKKIWWKCNLCGYEWQSTIAHRTVGNHGCFKCRINKLKARSKAVICIETNQQFESITLASKILNIKVSSISLAINGKLKTAGGYHWKYTEKED